MKTRSSTCLILALSLVLNGCASTYVGPGPNTKLRGPEAEKEIAHFTLVDGFWSQNGQGFAMGEDEKLYTNKSLDPIINQISPAAVAKLDTSQTVRTCSLVALGVAVVALVASVGDSDSANTYRNIYWASIGTSFGLSFYGYALRSGAASQYNQDLKNKFNPAVAVNYAY